jgi:hypothetical protein
MYKLYEQISARTLHLCSKHVEAVGRNKLKANSASCCSCYTDIA